MQRGSGSKVLSKSMENMRPTASRFATRVRRRASRVFRELPVRLSLRITSRCLQRKSQDWSPGVSIEQRPCWNRAAATKQVANEIILAFLGVVPCHFRAVPRHCKVCAREPWHCHRMLRRHWPSLRRSVHEDRQRFCLHLRVDPSHFRRRSALREVPARASHGAGAYASGMSLSERAGSGARSSHTAAGFEVGRGTGVGPSAGGSSVSGDPGGGGGGGGSPYCTPDVAGRLKNRGSSMSFSSSCNMEAELFAKCQASFGGCSRAARSSERSHLLGMLSCCARRSISAHMPL